MSTQTPLNPRDHARLLREVEQSRSAKERALALRATLWVDPRGLALVKRTEAALANVAQLIAPLLRDQDRFQAQLELVVREHQERLAFLGSTIISTMPSIPPIRISPEVQRVLHILADVDAVSTRGDPDAAHRIARLIARTPPGGVLGDALKVRAKHVRRSRGDVWVEALTEGVLRAAAWIDTPVPTVTVGDRPVRTEGGAPALERPSDLPLKLFWDWLAEEAARAAALWLVGYPYTPGVVLESPTADEDGLLRLARFVPNELPPPSRGGRPPGTTAIPVSSFPESLKQAHRRVEERKGGRRPSRLEVALELGIGERTLYDYLRRLGHSWPPS